MRRSLSARILDDENTIANGKVVERFAHRRDRSAGSALDLSGATIEPSGAVDSGLDHASPAAIHRGVRDEAPTIVLPNQEAGDVGHFAVDIGGSLIKIIYFTPGASGTSSSGGRLHFVKFETSKIDQAIDFIEKKRLHLRVPASSPGSEAPMRIKATGGGAYRFADAFKQRLGVVLEKEDEMDCLVHGANFLLQAIRDEAFTFIDGKQTFVPITADGLYPYVLVNIGSGVSLIKVDSPCKYKRVSGTSLGGGTFWGLCKLLTGVKSFDEMLELSMQGDNTTVDMLVGDIYGGLDYPKIGLSSSTIASSFGRVVADNKALEDYNPADLALALMRMVSFNIAQVAYLNAERFGVKRIFFGGFFIRGHPYTMETMSQSLKFWSQGQVKAMFLRHEGFLGSLGAFLKVKPMEQLLSEINAPPSREVSRKYSATGKVRAKFAELFSMGAPFLGGEVQGPVIGSMEQKVSWVERFIKVGQDAHADRSAVPVSGASGASDASGTSARERAATRGGAEEEGSSAGAEGVEDGGGEQLRGPPQTPPATPRSPLLPTLHAAIDSPEKRSSTEMRDEHLSGRFPLQAFPRTLQLNVGILQFSPMHEPFPLLADIDSYEPNTLDIVADVEERAYWLGLIRSQAPSTAAKAAGSEAGGGEGTRRRAQAFERALTAHMTKLIQEPGVYGRLGLAEVFELREECLREFNFKDVYRLDKERENKAALEVLPDLLMELDAMDSRKRLLALVEGVLAANIFDWGSKACEQLYRNGTILEIYKEARSTLSCRPWRVDEFDRLEAAWFSNELGALMRGPVAAPGADLQGGLGAMSGDGLEAPRGAGGASLRHGRGDGGRNALDHFYQRALLFVDNSGADVILGMIPLARELLRRGCDVVMVANSLPAINDVTAPELEAILLECSAMDPVIGAAFQRGMRARAANSGRVPPLPHGRSPAPPARAHAPQHGAGRQAPGTSSASTSPDAAHPRLGNADGEASGTPTTAAEPPEPRARAGAAASSSHGGPSAGSEGAAGSVVGGDGGGGATSADAGGAARGGTREWEEVDAGKGERGPPRLFVCGSGQGSPCLDLRRVSRDLADACEGADLLVIEGMGRAIHTNLRTRFRSDCLKLAMVKNQRLAETLFGGQQFDCVCIFEPGVHPPSLRGQGTLSPA